MRDAGRRSSALARLLCAFLLAVFSSAFAVAGDSAGFLVVLDSEPGRDGRHGVEQVTALGGTPRPFDTRSDPARSWRARFLAEDGRALAEASVGDPTVSLVGAGPAKLPLIVRFPDIPGAVLAEIWDSDGRLRAEVALDASTRTLARERLQRLRAGLVAMPLSDPDPSDRVAALRALERQLSAQTRQLGSASARCREGEVVRIPEVVGGMEWCTKGSPGQGKQQPASGMPFSISASVISGGAKEHLGETAKHVAAAAGHVRLFGQVTFASGVETPIEGFYLAAWGYFGDPNGVRNVYVAPPEFRYEVFVKKGADITIKIDEPPSPFVAMEVHVGSVKADTERNIELPRGAELTLRVRPPAGGEELTEAYTLLVTERREASVHHQSALVQPPNFEARIAVQHGASVFVEGVPPSPYLPLAMDLGVVDADLGAEIMLVRGARVSGRLRFADAEVLPSAAISIFAHGVNSGGLGRWITTQPPDFTFAVAAVPGSAVNLQPYPPAPFLSQVKSLGQVYVDTEVDVDVPLGLVVRGSVRAVGASLPTNYAVLVSQLGTGTRHSFGFQGAEFEVGVPAHDSIVEVRAIGFRVSDGFQPASIDDTDHEFVLEATHVEPNVRVRVTDPFGEIIQVVRVEVWREGRFFTSSANGWSAGQGVVRWWSDGEARLDLPDGDYEFRIWPDGAASTVLQGPVRLFGAPAAVRQVLVSGETRVEVGLPPSSWALMHVDVPQVTSWPDACGYAGPLGRAELLQGGRVVARGPMKRIYASAASPTGLSVQLAEGQWVLRLVMPGAGVFESPVFTPIEGAHIPVYAAGTAWPRWRGVLRDHLGSPIANRGIHFTDELGIKVGDYSISTGDGGAVIECGAKTDAQGRFELPLCQGCSQEFRATPESPSQRRIVSGSDPDSGDRYEDVSLGRPLQFAPTADTGLARVLGDADAPLRILFLAEGYVAERETFTDSNGNGIWDGVQFVDVNGDGVLNGEPFAVYGNAPWPVHGTDPRLDNEVIQDLNGDGVLSLDDRALFERNVQDYLRGLLSSHVLDRYRRAYQAETVMLYSSQAGMDHGDLWRRATRLDAAYDTSRSLISIDYSEAAALAGAADPNYDVVVVMINQPVPYGRVNSFILAGGGVLAGDVNDLVAAHEFGHNPGRLADEYSEYSGTYSDVSPAAMANSTRFVDRHLVSWGDYMPPERDGRPTKDFTPRDGLFEGSSYYPFGAYRPSHASLMRHLDSILFNRASMDQLRRVYESALHARAGLLEIEDASDCKSLLLSWDVRGRDVESVEIRAGGMDGKLVASGAEIGQVQVKADAQRMFLLDARDGTLLDIEQGRIPHCLPRPPEPPTQ